MSAKFKAAVRGNLEGWMRADANALARVHTNIVRTAGFRTQKGIKKQVKAAFDKAEKFEKAIRVVSNPPRGFSTRTSVRVYSKARYKASSGRRKKETDLLDVYSRTETVAAAGKSWMALPTKFAPLRSGRGGTRHAQPSECGLKLKFVMKDPNKAFLFHFPGRGGAAILMYVLVREVLRTARLNPDAVHRATLLQMSDEMQKIFVREDQRMRRTFGVGMSTVEEL